MTIRVEREALLTVINTSKALTIQTTSSSTSLCSRACNTCIRDENEFVIVDSVPTKELYSDLIPDSTGEDDLASLCTLSTSSLSSCDSSNDERRVSFATDLVTDVWTRERTLPEEVSNLFYSALETQTVCIFLGRISHVGPSTDSTHVLFRNRIYGIFSHHCNHLLSFLLNSSVKSTDWKRNC